MKVKVLDIQSIKYLYPLILVFESFWIVVHAKINALMDFEFAAPYFDGSSTLAH